MDPSKFFNRKVNIRNPKTPYGKGKFIDESKNYSNRISSRINQTPLTKSLFSIRKNLNQIQNTLTGILGLNDKSDKQKKKFELIENQEEKSKKKIKKSNNIFGNIIERPKTGTLGLIRDFVTFTFLGWLFTRLQPLLSGLGNLVPLLKGVSDFIGGTVWFLVDMLGSFVKFGYDAIDNVTGLVDNIKQSGKNLDKSFDDTLIALKDVFGGTIELVNSFLAVSVDQKELDSAKINSEKNEKIDNIPPLPPLPKAEQSAKEPLKSPDSFSNRTNIQGVYTGGVIRGYVDGGNLNQERIDPRSPITRGVQTKKKETPTPKPIIQPQQISPGKDIGGEKKIRELYDPQDARGIADFIPLPSFFRTSDKKSGFSALIGVSEELKKPNQSDILGIGSLMAASVSVPMGQKVEKKTYSQFAQGIKHLVNYGMTQPDEFAKIDLEDMIKKIIEPKVNLAINKIQEEINKKSKVEEQSPSYDETGGDGGMTVTGEDENFWALAAITSLENQKPQGQADVAQAIYNRVSSGLNFGQNNNSIKGHIIAPKQFSPVHESNPSLWAKIKDRESAIAAVASHRRGGKNAAYMVDQAAANITDSILQKSAAEGIGGRTDFAVPSAANIHPGGHGFVTRYGHLFGWYVGPESISFGKGRPKATQVPSFGVQRHATPTSPGANSGAYASGLNIGSPGDRDKQQTGLDMNLPGGIGTPIYAPFDLIYRNRGTDGRPAVGLNGTPGALGPSGVGFGFYGAYYYKVGNREYEVLMGHFKGLPLKGSREGQVIPKGTLLGYQGASGRSVSSTRDVYPHISLHINGVGFKASNSELVRVANAIARAKSGKQNIPSSPPTKPSSSTLPGLSDIGPRPGESSFLIKGKMYYVDLKTKSSNGTFVVRDQNNKKIKVGKGVNEWLLKEIQTRTNLRTPQKVSFTPTNPPLNANTNKLAYENSSGQSPIRREIQPIIYKETIPVPVSFGTPFVVSSTSGQISSNIQPLMKS